MLPSTRLPAAQARRRPTRTAPRPGALGAGQGREFGPRTEPSPRVLAVPHKPSPSTKQLDNATWTQVVVALVPSACRTRAPARAYVNTVLQRGSRGSAVVALQKALGSSRPTARFGPGTETQVKAYQTSKEHRPDRHRRHSRRGRPSWGGHDDPRPGAESPTPPGSSGSTSRPAGQVRQARPPARVEGRRPSWPCRRHSAISGRRLLRPPAPRPGSRRTRSPRASPRPASSPRRGLGRLMAPANAGPDPARRAAPTSSALTTEFTSYKATILTHRLHGDRGARCSRQGLGGLVVDGRMASKTVTAVKALPDVRRSSRPPASSTAPRGTPVERHVHPLLPYWNTRARKRAPRARPSSRSSGPCGSPPTARSARAPRPRSRPLQKPAPS